MGPKDQDGTDNVSVLNFRDIPKRTVMRAKIIAAIKGITVKQLLIDWVDEKWADMDKKGQFPK